MIKYIPIQYIIWIILTVNFKTNIISISKKITNNKIDLYRKDIEDIILPKKVIKKYVELIINDINRLNIEKDILKNITNDIYKSDIIKEKKDRIIELIINEIDQNDVENIINKINKKNIYKAYLTFMINNNIDLFLDIFTNDIIIKIIDKYTYKKDNL
jgi:Mg/Co/Ni transporter MgtE